jgi:hypothetical protein
MPLDSSPMVIHVSPRAGKLPVGTYTVTETNLGDVPLDVKDADDRDLNAITAVSIGVGTKSTGNDFADEKFVPGIGSTSGNVSEDKNNDDVADVDIDPIK